MFINGRSVIVDNASRNQNSNFCSGGQKSVLIFKKENEIMFVKN